MSRHLSSPQGDLDRRAASIRRKAVVRLCFLLFVCAAIALLAERASYRDTRSDARAEAAETLGELRVRLERVLNSDVQLVKGLVAHIRAHPEINQVEFAQVASYLMSQGPDIHRNIALARDLVVSHVYPVQENRQALGLTYRQNAEQWPLVEQAIQHNEITIAGPLDLVQGGTGLIARFPVFLDRRPSDAANLWGIASLVIDFPKLLRSVHFDRYRGDYDLVIYGRDAQGRDGAPFVGTPQSLDADPVALEVRLVNGSWWIEATPKGGWPTVGEHLWLIAGGTLLVFAVGLALIVWNVRFDQALVRSASLLETARREAVAARQVAEEASHTKTLFLANMSHELRTPLNAIIGFAQIMAEGRFGRIEHPRYQRYIADIYQASRHLLDLINEILDISRIEAGEVEPHDAPVTVGALVDETRQMLQGRIEEKGLTLELQVVPDLPQLQADATLVRQILVNIVGNAVKYTPSGGKITVTADSRRGQAIQIRIADDGPGIDPHLVPRALEPFTQLHRTHEVAHEGTGLGLPIAKRLMEAHGGRLSIRSNTPHGTVVVLDFPPARTVRAAAA